MALSLVASLGGSAVVGVARAQVPAGPLLQPVQDLGERLELIVNTSRILTLERKIPQIQVNNPEIVQATPLSANQVQVFAKKPGVTQVNLWDEKNEVHTVDVVVFGDAQELTMLLKSQFPTANIKVVPLSNSVVLSGYVDDPEQISRIVAIAEQYHPKVINNITFGGVQNIMLQVKVMEVSRTKLRQIGFDWANLSGDDFVVQGVSGLLGTLTQSNSSTGTTGTVGGSGTIRFAAIDGSNAFFGFLQALQQRDILQIRAEPNLVTASGRPARFQAGGEFPILVPQSLGTVAVQFRDFGTRIDFVPIVLQNNNIRLEVRPEVSEIDPSIGVALNGITVPGRRTRWADTGVEMRPGQTFVLAGLIQTRNEGQVRGLPWISDLPGVGLAFGANRSQVNEVELLILVTPQLVEPLDKEQTPCVGPGLGTMPPNDIDFYLRRHIEVPRCCIDGSCPKCQGLDVQDGGQMIDGQIIEPAIEVVPPGAPAAPAAEVRVSDQPQPATSPKPVGSIVTPARTRTPAPVSRVDGMRARPAKSSVVRPTTAVQSAAPPSPYLKKPNNAPASPEPQPPQLGFIGATGYDVPR